MKITVNNDSCIQLENVYSGVCFLSDSKETLSVCMRDTGFEINYMGTWYSLQKGNIEKLREEKYYRVMNKTDNILATFDTYSSVAEAEEVIKLLRENYMRTQGYYRTAKGEKIHPNDIDYEVLELCD
jgi:hypothetical protein